MRYAILIAGLMAAPSVAVTICEGAIRDSQRDRSIPVRVRMPDGNAKAPVILFSHGLGGSVDGGTEFGRAWAKAGFIVVHVQHHGSDKAVWQGNSNPRTALMQAGSGRQLRERIGDMKLVADAIGLGRSVGACSLVRADVSRMGAAGHSFGAHTVMALGGQRFGPMGALGLDPRFRAVAALSPTAPRNDAARAGDAFGAMAVPVLTATGSKDGSPLAQGKSLEQVVAARAAVFGALPASASGKGHAGLWVVGADHAAFGGSARDGRPTDPRTTQLVAAATTAFFIAHLDGNGTPDMRIARALLRPGDRIDQK